VRGSFASQVIKRPHSHDPDEKISCRITHAEAGGCQLGCQMVRRTWATGEKCLILLVAGEGFEPSTSGL